MQPWVVLDRVETADGVLELRRRSARDLLIALDDRILMSSFASGSEASLGTLVARALPQRARPRLLVAGLGMGITLRAALEALPRRASVTVVELNPVVVEWCRGPLAELSGDALADPRVRVVVGDVADWIRTRSAGSEVDHLDGIALDLYEGVRPPPRGGDDPVYGPAALGRAHAALSRRGVFGRWCEQRDTAFEHRLRAAGFAVRTERAGDRGRRFAVCLGIVR